MFSKEAEPNTADANDLEFDDLEEMLEDLPGSVEEMEVGPGETKPADADACDMNRTEIEKLQILEDRSRVTMDIADLQAKIAEPKPEDTEAQKVQDGEDESDLHETTAFASLHARFQKQAEFQFGNEKYAGEMGCMARMELMKNDLADFVAGMRVKEGLLSKSIIKGISPTENEWNKRVHELHLAKQYAKYRGARSSRFASWMSSQESLASHSVSKGKGEDVSEKALRPVSTLRPVNSNQVQFVLFEDASDSITSFHVGMVLSIYRGALGKAKGDSRRVTMAKPLSLASPSTVVARIKVLVMRHLEEGTFVANALCEQKVMWSLWRGGCS